MNNKLALIDDFGKLKAKIADLEKQEEALKEQLVELGAGCFEGNLFRVAITPTERTSSDAKLKAKVQALINKYISPQFLAAHTKKTPGWQVRASARNNEKVKELA